METVPAMTMRTRRKTPRPETHMRRVVACNPLSALPYTADRW